MKKKSFFTFKNTVLLFIIFMLFYSLINSKPFGVAKLKEITGGPSILDMEMGGYTVDKAYEILDALGEDGRAFHMKSIAPLDFPFPLSYALFYFVTLTLIAGNLFKNLKKPWLPGLIGLAGGLFDWLENIMVIILTLNFPDRLDGVARAANLFTRLKSTFITVSMLLILAGLVALAIKALISRHKAANV